MENKIYFEVPKQVIFADPDAENITWLVGIAYKDEVICADCGSVFEIEDIVESKDYFGLQSAIHPYENWVDIAVEIIGGEFPESLTYDEENNILIETVKN